MGTAHAQTTRAFLFLSSVDYFGAEQSFAYVYTTSGIINHMVEFSRRLQRKKSMIYLLCFLNKPKATRKAVQREPKLASSPQI